MLRIKALALGTLCVLASQAGTFEEYMKRKKNAKKKKTQEVLELKKEVITYKNQGHPDFTQVYIAMMEKSLTEIRQEYKKPWEKVAFQDLLPSITYKIKTIEGARIALQGPGKLYKFGNIENATTICLIGAIDTAETYVRLECSRYFKDGDCQLPESTLIAGPEFLTIRHKRSRDCQSKKHYKKKMTPFKG
jgi:hypothetical protein